MRRATRVAASLFGVFAGFGGPEHGYFEILQGNVKPDGLYIEAMGPPCNPEEIWNLCEPALTVIPSFLISGIVATILGIITMIWAAAFIHRKYGGAILILLSIALLLTGGGLFPPVIGIVAGITAFWINKPITKQPTRYTRFMSKFWPWPLALFFLWVSGQFVIGHYFNDWLMQMGSIVPLLIIGLLILSIMAANAYDILQQVET